MVTSGPQERVRVEILQARLAARVEPFDSYWQAPTEVEKGYSSFARYYKHNFLPHITSDRAARILVVSCGPGYLLDLLRHLGYRAASGIDSDPRKVAHATRRSLNATVARAFVFLDSVTEHYDSIICEQELNHLTLDEMLAFLKLCHRSLRPGGGLFVYGLNAANPLVGAENLAHNIDHFNIFTEYSLRQVLELTGFTQIRLLPLKLYVFWKNPLNYLGLAATTALEAAFRLTYALYGKPVKILTKKIAATCSKPA